MDNNYEWLQLYISLTRKSSLFAEAMPSKKNGTDLFARLFMQA
ncbi:MAG: hypothetical protein AB2L20_07145 [Mangrovibacterium sp.]